MDTGKTDEVTGKMKNDTGKITGKTIDGTGKIDEVTGKIESLDDLSGDVTGKMPETQQEETVTIRYRGQRGPDKKTRNYPHHIMKNLRQFQNVPHDNFRNYMQENKGVDVGGKNFNWNGLAVAILIVCAISVGGYGLWWLYNKRKHQNDNLGKK